MFSGKLYLGLIVVLACLQKMCSRPFATIELIDKNIQKFPKNYNGTISMTLSNNHISNITAEDVKGYEELEYLKINENIIRNTHDIEGIKGLPALKTIDLSNNLIRACDFRVFRHNKNLKTIILDHNHKIHFNKNTVTLLAVTKLSIKYCNLDDSFPWGILDGFTNLKILDLRHNKIKTIPKHVYNHLKSKLELLLIDDGVEVVEEVTREEKGIEKEIKKEKNTEEGNTPNKTNAHDKVSEEDTAKENGLEADLGKYGNTNEIITGKNTREEKPDSRDKQKPLNSTLEPFPKPDERNRETEKDSLSLLDSILITVLVICGLVLTVILLWSFHTKYCRRAP